MSFQTDELVFGENVIVHYVLWIILVREGRGILRRNNPCGQVSVIFLKGGGYWLCKSIKEETLFEEKEERQLSSQRSEDNNCVAITKR